MSNGYTGVSGDLAYGYNKETAWIWLDRMFRTSVDHPIRVQWLADANSCYAFEQGEQWSSKEMGVLLQRGQPAIVENEIRPAKERLIGKIRKQRTNVTYYGRNQVDDLKAAAFADLHRHIDYINGYEFVEASVCNDMLIGGVGWLEVTIKESSLGQPQVRYRREDPFAVYYDPFSRSYDINEDARYVCRAKWMYEDDARMLWPDKADEIAQAIGTQQPSATVLSLLDPEVLKSRNWWNLYFDQQHRRFRPVEIWYKRRMTEKVLETADGLKTVITDEARSSVNAAKRELPGSVVRSRSVDQLWCAVYAGGVILQEPQPYPYSDLFPLIPYWAYRKADGQAQGWVWQLMDPQREINARRSKAIWSLNNRQTIYERNAIKDKAELGAEMAAMDGQIEIEPGKFDRFMIRENDDITQGNLSMLQEAKMAIRRMSGEDQINPAPEIRSAAGLKRLEQSQENGVMTLFDHIRQSRRLKAIVTHDLVKEFYNEDMIFQVTDDPNAPRNVELTADHFDSLRDTVYDLVVSDTYDYQTSHQEQFTELLQALPQMVQFGPAWAGLLIQMSELRDKQGLLQIIDSMKESPAPTPKVSVSLQWSELSAEQQMAWAQKWGMPELVQAIAAKPGQPAHLVKEQMNLAKADKKAQADITKALIAHDSKRHDVETSHAMQREQHVADVTMQGMEMAQSEKESANEPGDSGTA